MVGEGDTRGLGATLSYDELLASEAPGYDWPLLDERQAAAMCYTSGTTGNPKGVVYSHRLHLAALVLRDVGQRVASPSDDNGSS